MSGSSKNRGTFLKALYRVLYESAMLVGTAALYAVYWPHFHYESDAAHRRFVKGKALIVSNHTNFLDPPLLCVLFRRRPVSVVTAKEVFEQGRGFFMKLLRCIQLDREIMDIACIKECVSTLRDGNRVAIFPEGSLNLDTELLPFKDGVSLIAFKADSQVVPVYISGDYRLFGHIHIMIGEAIRLFDEPHGMPSSAQITDATQELYEALSRLQRQLFSEMTDKQLRATMNYRQKFARRRRAKGETAIKEKQEMV